MCKKKTKNYNNKNNIKRMKISYGITVCDEHKELDNKDVDEFIIFPLKEFKSISETYDL